MIEYGLLGKDFVSPASNRVRTGLEEESKGKVVDGFKREIEASGCVFHALEVWKRIEGGDEG